MFTPAAGSQSAVADLSAQVASLQRSMRELKRDVFDLTDRLNQALESAGLPPMTTPPSSGIESGGTK